MNQLIKNICKQGKLKFVTPSITVANAYIEKSRISLGSASVLFSIAHYEDACASIYYSMGSVPKGINRYTALDCS